MAYEDARFQERYAVSTGKQMKWSEVKWIEVQCREGGKNET